MRKLPTIVGLTLAVAAGLLAPAPARASEAITVSATGTLTLWDRWDCISPTVDPSCAQNGGATPAAQPRSLFAPASPTCLGPGGAVCGERARWRLGTARDPGEAVECVVSQASGASGPCEVSARGTFFNSSGQGTWCGVTQGELVLEVSIGSFAEELGGSGNLHAGPFAGAWPLSQEGPPFGGKGVATLAAVSPPTCGLSPLDGYAGTHRLEVELTFTWTDAT